MQDWGNVLARGAIHSKHFFSTIKPNLSPNVGVYLGITQDPTLDLRQLAVKAKNSCLACIMPDPGEMPAIPVKTSIQRDNFHYGGFLPYAGMTGSSVTL